MSRSLQEILDSQDEIADWFESEGPASDKPISPSDYFLGLLADVRDLDISSITGAVDLALNAGASWQQVGDVLDVSADAAAEQFGAVPALGQAAPALGAPPVVGVQ